MGVEALTPKKTNAKKNGKGKVKPQVPTTVEIPILDGVLIHDEDTLREALEAVREAQLQIKTVTDFIEVAKNQATTYMNSHAVSVVQCDGHYWRLIQRFSRFFVVTDDDMPEKAPKSAKSIKSACQGKKVGKKKIPLWNFITKRVVDTEKLNEAVSKGYITQGEVDKAFLESPQKPFVQSFAGEAVDSEE
jgi:hypothetical protein